MRSPCATLRRLGERQWETSCFQEYPKRRHSQLLINAIEVFIDGWNEECRTRFHWTKIADEIFAKVKSRQKTSNARH
jgi:hypothetical protein